MTQQTKDIIRQTIIPIIEEEVNTGKNFANLRQIYNSMLLAAWYKKRLKESVLGQAYADQNNVKGIESQSHKVTTSQETTNTEIEAIWQKYVETFKSGAADLIKEDYDPASGTIVARKYFAGGFAADNLTGVMQAMLVPTEAFLAGSSKVGFNLASLTRPQDFDDWSVMEEGGGWEVMFFLSPDGTTIRMQNNVASDFSSWPVKRTRENLFTKYPDLKNFTYNQAFDLYNKIGIIPEDAFYPNDSAMLTIKVWNNMTRHKVDIRSPEFQIELGHIKDSHQFQAWFDGVDSYFVEIFSLSH